MAKCTALYTGSNSRGVRVEVAKSISGAWFERSLGFNGYTVSWSKWSRLENAPSHPSKLRNKVECADSPEYIDILEENRHSYIEWGFKTLMLSEYTGCRLPC